MTYFFETYGCQMNIAESASVEQLLLSRNWEKAETAETADLIIINTCSVRATAETRIFGRLGYYTGLKAVRHCVPDAKTRSLEKAAEYVKDGPKPITVVVMGCMAERLLDSLKEEWPVVDYVVGTYAKNHFGQIISAVEEAHSNGTTVDSIVIDDKDVYKFASLSYEKGSFSSYVPIMHGCNNFCTYCIVPYVRGREVSRPVQEILRELKVLSSYGVKEVTLLGQNVNSYDSQIDETAADSECEFASVTGAYKNQKIKFALLLEIICRYLDEINSSIEWVRFVSSHPKDLSDDVIEVLAKEERLCHHIHLPVQHGSTQILKAMNRRYTRENYLELVQKIRTRLPDVSMTTDVMLGFPGETEEDVQQTIDLMKTVRYESAFMYYYNVREGTPAAKMEDQIPVEEKKSRLQKIIDLQLVITREEMQKRVGQTIKVLVQNVSHDSEKELIARTEQDENIVFAADKSLIGKFAVVRIDSLNGNTFRGTLVK